MLCGLVLEGGGDTVAVAAVGALCVLEGAVVYVEGDAFDGEGSAAGGDAWGPGLGVIDQGGLVALFGS